MVSQDSFSTKSAITINGKDYIYYDIKKAQAALKVNLDKLPYSLKVIFENLLRHEDNVSVTKDDIQNFTKWLDNKKSTQEISYRPARVLMQDFTGVPAVVDLAAMRDAMQSMGGNPNQINPLSPVDLVIDHSVQVDEYGNVKAFNQNVELEFIRNKERYEFLKWGQQAFSNFRVVPPGTGICHQVNLEYLAQVVWTKEENGNIYAYPDTLVGTDSHTTMVNGLAVLGWGVGGIEAEAAMLGQPISMLVPEVIGFKLTGKLPEGATATDLVLTITNMLRKKGVVGKFVEFYGSGLSNLPLSDRATIANMAPEYGATCGFFPIDNETIKYLKLSARDDDRIKLVEEYAKKQGMWHDDNSQDPEFTDTLELDLSSVEPCVAGPKRPQDRIILKDVTDNFKKTLPELSKSQNLSLEKTANVDNADFKLGNGDIMIAAITSCTNTSNPTVMIAAGLVARNAIKLGLQAKPWVKTSLAPGSKVVTEYLNNSGLQEYLDKIGFNLVGYGCTTCIGNSGPLKPELEKCISDNDLVVSSVLSGNRNFEGRIHPLVRANYLASPPLVVAYALAGSMNIDIANDPIAQNPEGKDIYLKDIWPSNKEIADLVHSVVTPEMFKQKYADVFTGDQNWQNIKVSKGLTYDWNDSSTYVKNPPYFENMSTKSKVSDIIDAKMLCLLGDSVTTDHISPAGNIAKSSPAAEYLLSNKVAAKEFNSYGSRRGNHEVMMRGTFANVRIKNKMVPEKEGGYTKYLPNEDLLSIYDAAMKYKKDGTSLVVVAGKEYGTGSSRDWAAKGTFLLGIKAVIAESFERIHRSNLVGMGVLPLMFTDNNNQESLKLTGKESWTIQGLENLQPAQKLECIIKYENGEEKNIKLLCRIDTIDELNYYKNGGILHNVLINMLQKNAA